MIRSTSSDFEAPDTGLKIAAKEKKIISNHRDVFVVLSFDVTTYCICEIHCLELDGFDLNTVHKLICKEKILGGAGI